MKLLMRDRKMIRVLVPLMILMLVTVFTMSGCSGGEEAEKTASTTIITNADLEVAGDNEDATAVVLQDGKIAYVGDDEGAMEYDGDDTEVIDAEGRTVMPAMTEAHMHFSTALQAKYEIDLADVLEIEEMQDIISVFF